MVFLLSKQLAALRVAHRKWHDRLFVRGLAVKQLIDHTGGRVPKCATCADHCCKAPHDVHLRLDDIARLRDAGLGHAVVAPPQGGLTLYAEPTLAKDATGVCVFFSQGRCSIYDLRPIVCQRFPYFIAADEKSLSFATSCSSFEQGDDATRRALTNAALQSYNLRALDGVLIRRARSALTALGLLAASTGERFAATLRKP